MYIRIVNKVHGNVNRVRSGAILLKYGDVIMLLHEEKDDRVQDVNHITLGVKLQSMNTSVVLYVLHVPSMNTNVVLYVLHVPSMNTNVVLYVLHVPSMDTDGVLYVLQYMTPHHHTGSFPSITFLDAP